MNPRLTYYPPPVVVNSVERVKQGAFSAENLSAWVGDNAPNLLSTANSQSHCHHYHPQHQFTKNGGMNGWVVDPNRRLATAFGSNYLQQPPASTPGDAKPLTLFTMSTDGMMTEYRISATPMRERNTSSGSSASEPISSSPISYSIHTSMSGPKSGVLTDTPIKASVTPSLQWMLTRYLITAYSLFITSQCQFRNRGSSVEIVDPPLSEVNPLIKASSDEIRHAKPARHSWLQNVEASTYSGPYRRLWMVGTRH